MRLSQDETFFYMAAYIPYPMEYQSLYNGIFVVGVAILSHRITNAIAIKMLFNPHEPLKIGPWRLQGALPKNKARLAKAIGKTVGEKLLTPEDLAERLSAPPIRDAYARALDGAVGGFLAEERGPLLDLLGPEVRAKLEAGLGELAHRGADSLAAHTTTPAFEAQVGRLLEQLKTDLGDRPIGEVLTDERRAALHRAVQQWLGTLVEGDEFRAQVEGWVMGQLERLQHDDRALADRLPAGVLGAIEHAVADYLPVAVERLGGLLADPDAKGEVKRALREAFDSSVREMLVHERLLAKLFVTDKAIGRFVDGFEGDGFERLATTINAPEMRARITSAVADAVHAFLRVPLGDRLRRLGPERRAALASGVADWLVLLARDPGTRNVAAAALDRTLAAVDRRTWGDLLGAIPPAEVAKVAQSLVADGVGRARVEESIRSLALTLLGRPMGRPIEWLGEENAKSLTRSIVESSWAWVQAQVPGVVGQLEIPAMVEQKINALSTQKLEELVRNVTEKELRLIINMGYVLGAVVGVVTWVVTVVIARTQR